PIGLLRTRRRCRPINHVARAPASTPTSVHTIAIQTKSTAVEWPAGIGTDVRRAGLDTAPAVDLHRDAGDHRRLVAAEKTRGIAQVLRRREAPDRDRREELRAHLRRVLAHEGLEHRRLARDRVERIDADTRRRE